MHCYWKHFQVLFPAFCKYRCGFRQQKLNTQTKHVIWCHWTDFITLWREITDRFPTEICPGQRGGVALNWCNYLHHSVAGSCSSGAERVTGGSFCHSGHYNWWREFGVAACSGCWPGQLCTHTSINGAWHKRSCQLLSRSPCEYFITFEEMLPQRRQHICSITWSALLGLNVWGQPNPSPGHNRSWCLINPGLHPNALSAHAQERNKSPSPHTQLLQHRPRDHVLPKAQLGETGVPSAYAPGDAPSGLCPSDCPVSCFAPAWSIFSLF